MAQHAQLRAVYAVYEHGGFSRAASALGLTQPAISDHVRRVEQDYGVALFHRRGRSVEPTELCKRLVAAIEPMLEGERQAVALLSSAASCETGTLSMIADAPDLAARLIAEFRTKHPRITVTLAIANAETCTARVLAHAVDVAITAVAPVDTRLHGAVLRREMLMGLVPKESALARKGTARMMELVEAGLIFREPRSVTQRALVAELGRQGLSATPALTVDGREALIEGVAAGVGVGVISPSEFGGRSGVRRIRLADVRVSFTEHIVVRSAERRTRLLESLLEIGRGIAASEE